MLSPLHASECKMYISNIQWQVYWLPVGDTKWREDTHVLDVVLEESFLHSLVYLDIYIDSIVQWLIYVILTFPTAHQDWVYYLVIQMVRLWDIFSMMKELAYLRYD